MRRYVVHLPPTTVTIPFAATITLWSREIFDVAALPVFTSGRSPDHTLNTSLSSTSRRRYRRMCSRKNSCSCPLDRGSTSACGTPTSVVPTTRCSCHGIANSTRPSSVLGTIKASVPGKNVRGNTKCDPWLIASNSLRGSPSSRSTCSAKIPAAFTTVFAWISHSLPVSASRTRTPAARPSRSSTFTTAAWFSAVPPTSNSVSSNEIAYRASSNCPSKYNTPPRSARLSTVGSRSIVSARESMRDAPNESLPDIHSYTFNPKP